MLLPRYQVYANFMSNRKATGWMQGQTLPPDPPIRMAAELKAESMKRYGKPAEQVDDEYLATLEALTHTKDELPEGDRNSSVSGAESSGRINF